MIMLSNEPMSAHTTFRVGGPADKLYIVENAGDACDALTLASAEYKNKGTPYYIVGNGSNLLVSDSGIRGTVILISDKFSDIKVSGNSVYADAGAYLSKIANAARDASLTGFEFAAGIPGSLGGAVAMNAGAYGGELCQVIKTVSVISDGKFQRISAGDMGFSYRHSIALDKEMIILGAEIELMPGDPVAIKERMNELSLKRREKQPLEYPSAGSTFKRPEGYFAGKLIEDSGLKGCRIGGAEVSSKHSGFIINTGNATASDIYSLIKYVQSVVFEKYEVMLQTEVRLIGDFDI